MLSSNFMIRWYLDDIQIFIINFEYFDDVLNKILILWFWVDVTTKALLKKIYVGLLPRGNYMVNG